MYLCHFNLTLFVIYLQLKSKSLTHLDRLQPQINIQSNYDKVNLICHATNYSFQNCVSSQCVGIVAEELL